MRTKQTTKDSDRKQQHVRPLQRDVLRDVMLSAAECDTWLTPDELARMTAYPPASISAQLRHLRKQQHGGYQVEKRCRAIARFMTGVDERVATGPVWEYRLDRQRVGRCAAIDKASLSPQERAAPLASA